MQPVSLIEVTPEESGQKLVQFLQRRIKDLPQSALMRWIRTGQVRVDGKRSKPFARVEQGQKIRIPPHDTSHTAQEETPPSQSDAVRILAEQSGLLVVDKPAGLPVHGGTGHTDSLQRRLAQRYAHLAFTPTPAHRLDRDTTGLILFALSYARLKQIQDALRSGKLKKTYLAWVRGLWPEQGECLLSDRLEKQGAKGSERVETGKGKHALARARCLLRKDGCSLLALELLTGRTHQLRVQLASRGFPIIGDKKYGCCGRIKEKEQTLRLHAWRVVLIDEVFECIPSWKGKFAVSSGDFDAKADRDASTGGTEP